MQPCSQQGSDLGVEGGNEGVSTAASPWAPVAAAAGLIALCAQAFKDNRANKQEPKAACQVDTDEFQRIVKKEDANLAPPGFAYITSMFDDFHMRKTGHHIISMQHYIEAMDHEKQCAREKAGRGDISEQPMVAVITAEGKMLFWATFPVL